MSHEGFDREVDVGEGPGDIEREADEMDRVLQGVINDPEVIQGINLNGRKLTEALERAKGDLDGAQADQDLDRRVQASAANDVVLGQPGRIKQLEDVLSSATAAQSDEAQFHDARRWSMTKFMGAGGLHLKTDSNKTYNLISYTQSYINDHPSAQPALEDPFNNTRQYIQAWIDQSEDSFWEQIAKYYIPVTKYSLLAQINNAQMLIYLARASVKLNPKIRWQASEKVAVVDGLVKTYLEQGSKAMYLSVTGYRHNDKVLPRVVALQCVSLALGQVVQHVRNDPELRIQSSSMLPNEQDSTLNKMQCHLEPILVFMNILRADLSVQDYASAIVTALNHVLDIPSPATNNGRAIFGADSTHFETEDLDLVYADEVLSNISDEKHRMTIQNFADNFLTSCSDNYPLLDGESITIHNLAILRQPYNKATPGALVYVRTTNLAQTAFIVYRVHFDRTTERWSFEYPVLSQMPKPDPFSHQESEGADAISKYITPVAMTLSFALPPPWGPGVAAAFQILGEIFGGLFGGGPDIASLVTQLMTETVKAIEALLTKDKIRSAMVSIKSFVAWFGMTANGLKQVKSSDELWIKGVIKSLADAQNPSFVSNIYNSLFFLSGDDVLNWENPEVLQIAFVAATTLFLSQRLRCQLYALLASFALDRKDLTQYDLYAGEFHKLLEEYRERIRYWSDTLSKRLDDITQKRLDQISTVQYYNDRTSSCHESICVITGDDGYYFADKVAVAWGQPAAKQPTEYKYPNIRTTENCKDHVESREQVAISSRDYLINLVRNMMQAIFSEYRLTISRWNQSLTEVVAMMPPTQPPRPSITKWTEQAPDPGLKGKSVRYLVCFINGKGPSSISQASEPSSIQAGKAPEVSIPVDPEGMTTKREIYRQLVDEANTLLERELVDTIIDNTTKVWLDNVKTDG